jgi:hypothetical protein
MRGPARRRPALRTVAAVLSVLVAATALTVPASSAAAASGPSVTPPDTTSTPVDQQSMGAHAQDPASKNELHGNQTPPNGPTDGGGTSKASPLSPSATWSVSAQSGNFSWKYPLRLPPAPGDFVPQLGLAYSSSAIDGRTSATNNQPSWVGDGWDLSAGFLERSYIPCADDTMGGTTPPKVGDLCWRSENATASYGSHASELVRDDKNGTWHPRADDGSRVEQKFGAGNGDDNGEYWKITTTDGTQYLFGSDKDANSTWTVPVFGDDDKEPCHQLTFEASHCVQAWRWNLDKVIDRNGNVIKYHYAKETNQYGMDKKDAATEYVRGGTITTPDSAQHDDVRRVRATGRLVGPGHRPGRLHHRQALRPAERLHADRRHTGQQGQLARRPVGRPVQGHALHGQVLAVVLVDAAADHDHDQGVVGDREEVHGRGVLEPRRSVPRSR